MSWWRKPSLVEENIAELVEETIVELVEETIIGGGNHS